MIYFLDGNQEVIKIVRSSAVISAIQTQELPEDNSLLRDYLSVRLKNDERLFNAQYMAIKSYGGNRNAFDLYRIASEIVPDNATEFMGVQVAPYELEGVVIEDLRPQNRPLNQTMNQVLEGSDWRIGYVADNLPNVTTNFYYTSVKDALKKIQELTNTEMVFKVEITGNKITDKWVEVYHQLGNRTMKRFNYGTNALSVVRESSHDELYTALIGRGKGEEVGEMESGDATYGRKINFADVEWKESAGKPVDKPKGQKYIELPNATAEYGIKLLDGRKVPRIGIVEFSETDDPEKLIQETYQELLARARPKVLFKASVINTGDMLIGDTVTIHRHDLDFHYQARVRKVVRDRRNNNKTQVEIGDVVHTASTKRQSNINSALNNVASGLDSIRGEVTEARQSADGKNTNFYGNVEPNRKKVGDTWFRDHPSLTGESQILVWNGEAWELIMDTSETTKNAREIEKAMEEAEEAKQQAKLDAEKAFQDARAHADAEVERINTELSTDIGSAIEVAEQAKQDAIDKANQALEDAKAHAEAEDARIRGELESEVGGAIYLAEQAKQDAVTKANQALEDAKAHADAEILQFSEHFDGVLESVESDVADAQATADEAVNEINTAVTNANFTSLDEAISNVRGIKSELDIAIKNANFTSLDATLQNMRDTTMDAEQRAQEAIDNASNAYGLAQTSISEAQTAQEKSLTALGKADNAIDGVKDLDIRVDDVEAELELKADNTFLTEDDKVITLSNAITLNAYKFSSDMSRIESRVESLAGEINLVILRDAFVGTQLVGGETYPTPTKNEYTTFGDTMREMIDVEPGEQLALSKDFIDGLPSNERYWRVNFYLDNTYVSKSTSIEDDFILTVPNGVNRMWVSYPRGSKPQIVRGTDFIPYRPNMADQMTTDEIVIFRNEYDEFADRSERRLSAIDGTGGRLETSEALLTQTAEGLKAKAEQSTVDELTGEINSIGTLAETTAGRINNKVWNTDIETAIDDLEIGGSNLIPFSKNINDWLTWGTNTKVEKMPLGVYRISRIVESTTSVIGVQSSPSFSLKAGNTYTLSYKALQFYGTLPNYIYILSNSQGNTRLNEDEIREVGLSELEVVPETYAYQYKLTFTASKDITDGRVLFGYANDPNNSNRVGFYLAEPQLENGSVMTAYSPAISDTSEVINHIQTEWTQTFEGFESTVSDNLGAVNTNIQTLENSLSAISDPVTGRLTIAEQSLDGFRNEVYNQDCSSKITQLATGVNSLVEGIHEKKNLIPSWEIGGISHNNGQDIDSQTDRMRSGLITKTTKGYSLITFSINGVAYNPYYIIRYSRSGEYYDHYFNERHRVTLSDSVPYARIVVLHTDTNMKFQAEEGDSPTAYVPYVSDVSQSQINNITTEWTQTFDTFSQTVSGIDGRVTTQKQTIDNISSTVYNEHAEKISKVEQTAEGLQTTVADKANQSQVTQLATGFNSFVGGIHEKKNLIPYWEIGGVSHNNGQDLDTQTDRMRSGIITKKTEGSLFVSFSLDGVAINPTYIMRYRQDGVLYDFFQGRSDVTLTDFAPHARIVVMGTDTNRKYQAEEGSTVSEYVPYVSDVSQTQISQLADNINLRVEKGKLLSQINIEAERTLIQTGKLLLDAKNTIVTGDFAVSGNAIVGGDMQLNKGLRVMNGTNSVLSVVNGNVRMNVGSLFIGSENVENKISTAIYQNNKSIGLIYTDGAGREQSLLSIGADGVYVGGKHIILNGDTVVTDGFMVTGGNVTLNADTTVLGDFTVSGGNVILDANTIVTGDFAVLGKNIVLDGNTTVRDNFTVTGGNIILDGETTVHDNFTVTGGNVVLDANTRVQGNFTVSGGNVILDGNTTVRGGFTVLGQNVTLDANTTILGDFSVFGKNIILDGDTTVHGDFSVFGKNIILDGDTTVTGDFTVGGDIVGSGIRADNITTGKLDAGQITVVNLDVDSLSGNTSDFVSTAWNTAAGGNVSITGSGIVSTTSTNAQTYIQNGVVGFRGTDGSGTGFIGYSQRSNHPHLTVSLSNSRGFYLRYSNADGTYKPVFEYAHYNDQLQAGVNLSLTNNNITNVDNVYAHYFRLRHGGYIRGNSADSTVDIKSLTTISLQTGSGQAFKLDNTHGYMHRTLSMEGNNITNQSDRRLKLNIKATDISSLDSIKSIKFVEFDRTNGNHDEIGVIAQDTPSLALYDSDRDMWSINSSKQIMMNSHAIQQLYFEFDERVESNESKIHKLQQELSKANRRIEELERVM